MPDVHLLVATDHTWRLHCGAVPAPQDSVVPLALKHRVTCRRCCAWPQPASLVQFPQSAQVLTGQDHSEAHTRTAPQQGKRTETEKCFMARVLAEAQRAGWLVFHVFDSRRSQKGFPDLVLAKPGHNLIMGELKSEKGKITTEQAEWLRVLSTINGVSAHVWRPEDWPKIHTLLYEKSHNAM